MESIIAIEKHTINDAVLDTVNARDLHIALDIKRDFNAWITDTREILETYEEGIDYIRTTKDRNNAVVVVKKSLNLKGKQTEYIMTLDMCKHISMMSQSLKGREVRKYFIEVEKLSNKPLTLNEQIALIAQGQGEFNERLERSNDRLHRLENEVPVSNQQQVALTSAKCAKVYGFINSHPTEFQEEDARKLHRKVWQLFKKRFSLPRYNELPNGSFNEGLSFINNLTLGDML